MGWLSGLGALFAPGEAQAVEDASSAIGQKIAPGSAYWNAGDLGLSTPGTQGNALLQAAAGVGGQNISANFVPIDQDTAALRDLSNTYAQQFAHGGKAEAAAKNRAMSAVANAGGGGIEGIKALNDASQQISGQAEQTSLQERGASGDAATQTGLAAGMLQLRKVTMQAAITHASIQKNLAAQNAINMLQKQQTNNTLRLREGAQQADHARTMGDIEQQQLQSQIGQGVLSGIASAGAQIGGSIASMSGSSVDVPTLTNSEIQSAANAKLAQFGIPANSPAASYNITGQEAAQATQNALMQALGTQSSKISYPSLQSTATSVLSDPSSYPLTTSMRS